MKLLRFLNYIQQRHYLLVPVFFFFILFLLTISSLFIERGGGRSNPYLKAHWHGFGISYAVESFPENFRYALLGAITAYMIYLVMVKPWKKLKRQ
jgi:hypothetical protein